ncbi:hypothetical protein HRI_003400700 [Hibiscus trionum]|uniref:Reverse transcriptase n=1 Tax=Hibiscus trionum TaxID=183268 RepID=A0A9W7IJL8_HIBTR|nr:hypothetical protein HRI_003400700 [Hibiscus trionum]
MAMFRDTLEDCHLSDLGFRGTWYTWERGRLASTNVRERLDRVVANPSWWQMFPGYLVSHLQHSISDHCPLLLDTAGAAFRSNNMRPREFRFEANWILEDGVEQVISQCWENTSLAVPNRLHEL